MRKMLVFLSTKLEIYLPSGDLTLLLKMAIVIVDLFIKNGDFPQLCKRLPEGIYLSTYLPIYLSTYLPIYLSISLSLIFGTSKPATRPCEGVAR